MQILMKNTMTELSYNLKHLEKKKNLLELNVFNILESKSSDDLVLKVWWKMKCNFKSFILTECFQKTVLSAHKKPNVISSFSFKMILKQKYKSK